MHTILYVDDEPELLDVGRRYIEKESDFKVETLLSATEALHYLDYHTVSAIISDFEMPGMDGIEFLKDLRARDDMTPFIIFTGKGREEVVIEALNAGAIFYLQKGGDPTPQFVELRHKVKQAIDLHTADAELKESEQRYRNVVEDQNEFICRFLPDGTHIFVNDAYCRYFNMRREAIIGKQFIPGIPREDRRLVREHFSSLTRESPAGIVDHRIMMPDGTIRWQRWSDRAIFNEEGHLIEYQSVGRDISAQKEMEEALRDSTDHLNTIVQFSPIPQFVIDRNHHVMHWNKALERYSGIPAREVIGTDQQWRAFYPDKRPCLADLLVNEESEKIPEWYEGKYEHSKLVEGGYEVTDFFSHMGSSGIWLFFTAVPIRNAQGAIIGAVETLEDITERKKALEALAESEQRYRNVVEDQNEFICRFLPDGTHIFVNEAYCRYFNIRREDIIGKKILYHIPAEEQHLVREHFTSLTRENPTSTIDHRIIMPDGSVRWQRWSDRAIFDEAGELTEYQSVSRDITEMKQAEQALRESGRLLTDIIEFLPDATFVIDRDKRVIAWNRAIEQMTGIPKSDIVGKGNQAYALPYYSEAIPILIDSIFSGKTWIDSRYQNITNDANTITAEVFIPSMHGGDGAFIWATASVLYDDAGNVSGAIESIRDITERKTLEMENEFHEHELIRHSTELARDIAERRKIEEALRTVNHQLNLLTGITRHDINNKITAILGYLDIAEERIADPFLMRQFNQIKSLINAIQALIAETRVYQDLGSNEPQWQNLGSIMPRSSTPQSIRFIADLSDTEVFADPMFAKVFFNLQDNSVRHGVTVTEIRVSTSQSGDHLQIIWEDNGIGISDEQKEKIFERGFGKNTGLGMFLVREVLSLTGITIREAGEFGKGVRFEITIPPDKWRISGLNPL